MPWCRLYTSRVFESSNRGSPTSLRGWLSDIYVPVLLDDDEDSVLALAHRLGGKATVDDPIFGRTSGLPALERYVAEVSSWLKLHQAKYTKSVFTTGTDRDVTEGTLVLTFDAKSVELPIAVVAERRRSREVELRIYYSTQPIKGTKSVRSPLVPNDEALTLPPAVTDHIEALKRGDADAIVLGFEAEGKLRDARGHAHDKSSGLREFYAKLFDVAASTPPGVSAAAPRRGGVEILKGRASDDGRNCAFEYTVIKMHGRDIAPQAGLAVYERGDSGLIRAVRIYDDVETTQG